MPLLVVLDHFLLLGQLRIAEARIGIVGEANIQVEHDHVLHRIHVLLRKFIAETVHICQIQCLAENVDGCQMIMRIELKLSAVFVYLYSDFTVQDIDTALAPCGCLLEFREEDTSIHDALCFEQQVISLIGIILKNVNGMFVIVQQELSKELRSKRRRGDEQLEL